MSSFRLPVHHLPELVGPIAQRYWQRLGERDNVSSALIDRVKSQPALALQLAQVWVASDYAANLCIQQPGLLLEIADNGELWGPLWPNLETRLREQLAPLFAMPQPAPDADRQLKQVLRQFQQGQLLRLIWRDVCHLASVRETAAEISRLAELMLEVTLDLLYQWAVELHGMPMCADEGMPQRLVVIGMGKLGAGELNLSSDIDLMFAYPGPGETTKGVTCHQFFTRLGQHLIDVLDTVTADGFVFRVDMRLRPYGRDGVLACSFDAMENYYQLQGRDWERYAMLKARIVAGDHTAGAELLQRLRPFSYRRYLDFSAFESLRVMKEQINKQVMKKEMNEDIKLGAGGIREAEFVVQALQMVHGGRDRRLQQVSWYATIDQLREGGYLSIDSAQSLVSAYTFLRDLEHKLQGFANEQTQALPVTVEHQQRIAVAMGVPVVADADWSAVCAILDHHRAVVHQQFKAVIRMDEDEDDATRHDVDDEALRSLWHEELTDDEAVALLAQHGFEEPGQTWQQLGEFRRDRIFRTLPADSRQRFSRFMPLLLATLGQEKTPSRGFLRVMKLVEAVARRTAYLVLLTENPRAMKQFVHLCHASPFVADFLSHNPVLLDELLHVMRQPPGKAELQDELEQALLRIGEESIEEQLDYLRYFKLTHTLQVAAAQISGTMTVMKVSDYLTFIAEAILEQVLSLCWQHLTRRHGYPVNSLGEHGTMDFVVIAYGKLGGIELSYVSDLDVVFAHDGVLDEDTVTTGEQRSLNSREFYTRLAQRVISMLGTRTASGKLYEVDMRLRPSGESGLLVTTLPAFESYQCHQAWTWEHQALVRARAVAGSPRLMADFENVRREILGRSRAPDALTLDVVSMRRRMREELTRKSGRLASAPAFVIKQGQGGIVDIEFMVQYLVLRYAADYPSLTRWSDNVRILESLASSELLPSSDIDGLTRAYLLLRSTLHELALQDIEGVVDSEQTEAVLSPLDDCRTRVTMLWMKLLGASDEHVDTEAPAPADVFDAAVNRLAH